LFKDCGPVPLPVFYAAALNDSENSVRSAGLFLSSRYCLDFNVFGTDLEQVLGSKISIFFLIDMMQCAVCLYVILQPRLSVA